MFNIDAGAPGNWDFLYGPARFEQTFLGTNGNPPLANWHAMAANLYSTTKFDDTAICGVTATDPATGLVRLRARILPSYMIKQVGNVKVGILGFTTARAIAAISPKVTAGYLFNDGNVEVPCFVNVPRNTEKVDLVVLISELELARDIKLMETYTGVDVVLNSDMHEKTVKPIVVPHANGSSTLLLEEGQDGTMVGKLELEVAAGTDAAAIRGFRYGTHVPAGWPITMQDIYHYIPIASKVGRSTKACGADLKFQVEQSTDGTFNPDPTRWSGGWMFGYSNVSFDLGASDGFLGATPTPIGTAGPGQLSVAPTSL